MSSLLAGKTTFSELYFFLFFATTGEKQNLMRKRFLAALWIIPVLCTASTLGAQQIKNIKIAISNPGDHPRNAADIVIPIAQLRKSAPDFTPGATIVTVSDAGTPEQDASVLIVAPGVKSGADFLSCAMGMTMSAAFRGWSP